MHELSCDLTIGIILRTAHKRTAQQRGIPASTSAGSEGHTYAHRGAHDQRKRGAHASILAHRVCAHRKSRDSGTAYCRLHFGRGGGSASASGRGARKLRLKTLHRSSNQQFTLIWWRGGYVAITWRGHKSGRTYIGRSHGWNILSLTRRGATFPFPAWWSMLGGVCQPLSPLYKARSLSGYVIFIWSIDVMKLLSTLDRRANQDEALRDWSSSDDDNKITIVITITIMICMYNYFNNNDYSSQLSHPSFCMIPV